MVQGTTVAIRVGDAMRRELGRLGAPLDLRDDLMATWDALIVHALRAGNRREDKERCSELADQLVQTFAVAVEVAWEQKMNVRWSDDADQA